MMILVIVDVYVSVFYELAFNDREFFFIFHILLLSFCSDKLFDFYQYEYQLDGKKFMLHLFMCTSTHPRI